MRQKGLYHRKVPSVAGGSAEDLQGGVGQYYQIVLGIFFEFGGFAPARNFLGILANSA
jgi:hypothetical protein